MEAVASKAVMPKALKIELSNVKAILNPPPAILDTISIAANRPLNVRFNLSAVLSLIINCVVNLWNAAIALNNCSGFIGSNTSLKPSPILLNIFTRDLPMFLNESISNQRPFISSILSIKSSSGMPI